MDTCVVCGLTSDDPTLFTGHDPVVCIACHLELCEDKPQMRTISIEDFVEDASSSQNSRGHSSNHLQEH